MPYNVDSDPRNANWVKYVSNWDVPAKNLKELFVHLRIDLDNRIRQEKTLKDFIATSKYKYAPDLIKKQAVEFLNGFELRELSPE
jgi:hypothetical protein